MRMLNAKKTSSHKGFDRLSAFYDFLVSIVFGRAIFDAQYEAIKYAKGKNWLVIGGGTGWVLEEIFRHHPTAKVTYLDASQKMIAKAKKRNIKGQISFKTGSIEQIESGNTFYDVIMTPFFWDMFTTDTAISMKQKLELLSKKDTNWLVVDFQNVDSWWQRLLMRSMYLFFRVICSIEANKLPDLSQLYHHKHHKLVFQQSFFHHMILSTIYRQCK